VPVAPFEASAIAIQSLNVVCEKPLTIDLVKQVLDACGGKIDKLVIKGSLGDPRAFLYIIVENGMRVIECRCGDGIALVMRCAAKIFVDENIFGKNWAISAIEESDRLKVYIADVDTLDFGKYYL
jgi:bifunctional DNase/RNase